MKRVICTVTADENGELNCVCADSPEAASAAFVAVACHAKKLGADLDYLLACLPRLTVTDKGRTEGPMPVWGGAG
jgi:hypothetical protein